MSVLAVITARGGSKRIPRKNIREFCGKPIIVYSIEAALGSHLFDEVMVSTDDEEIAEISRSVGAKIPFCRSEKTSDDFATTRDVLLEVIDKYESMGVRFEYLCCIYPTAPFVTPEALRNGYDVLIRERVDKVMPVVRYECPPQWSLKVNENGLICFNQPECVTIRSQDLEPLYHDAGQFYWFDVNRAFYTNNSVLSTAAVVVNENEVQDIDDEFDWQIAEMKYKILNSVKD